MPGGPLFLLQGYSCFANGGRSGPGPAKARVRVIFGA